MGKTLRKSPRKPRAYDPQDTSRIKHTRIGVWDFYEEKHSDIPVPGISRLEIAAQMLNDLPYVWRMLKDICTIPRCLLLILIHLTLEVAGSFMPALSLWYYGQLILLVETAVEKRTINKDILLYAAVGRVACTIAERLLHYFKSQLSYPLNLTIKQFYSARIFHAMARLDVPTFEDPAVQHQLESAWSMSSTSSVAWDTIQKTSHVITISIRLFSQVFVLITVLSHQRDGTLLALLSFAQSLFQWFSGVRSQLNPSVWAATTKDQDYIRMQGYKHLVDNPIHRKELVAGTLGEHLTKLYTAAARRIGSNAGDFYELRQDFSFRDRLTLFSILREPMRELPQIVFAVRAVQYPESIPVSIASFTLINHTASTFTSTLFALLGQSFSLADQFASVRKLYEISNIPNKVVDGNTPFPENQQTLRHGISIEFRNVSFQYPGSVQYALRNVSFKIGAGQLCVIVGVNGSGKSTILKLISRIYDPTEGTIFIYGKDIKTFRLADLRRAMSILFQDYTHFPLSIKENISLGNHDLASDDAKIREAAHLGGAEELVDQLPEGFDTYLDPPVRDYYSALPEGTTMLFGRKVNFSGIRSAGAMRETESSTLSGGQMQRLAVSRTFMRSLSSEPDSPVGLLLFDEPSASLDPTAEHDLFERLCTLRGSKTMVFSTHRFGNLARNADLILYLADAEIKEAGTHEALLTRDGEYARIWRLQAKAFL